MDNRRTQPIGIELVKRGIVGEGDINKALEYQKGFPLYLIPVITDHAPAGRGWRSAPPAPSRPRPRR